MKFIKALLRCLLGFTLAFLLMFFLVYREYKAYKDIPTITLNVGTGDLANNKLPTLENIELSFPGFSDNEIYNCTISSNVTIKVVAINAKDEDGMISRLTFYYYNVDDPDRILDYKETWIGNPYVYFSLPRIGGEYKFGVKVYDNNGGMIDSEEYLGSNPSLYFPSCNDGDVPMVTLKISPTDIEIGDTVTYTVISRIALDSGDFEKNKQIYYDFTGDGTWDLVTGSSIVDYTFTESYPNGVKPTAAVEYRGKLGIGYGANIYVGKYDYTNENSSDIEDEIISEYEVYKMEIMSLMSKSEIRQSIEEGFAKFEEVPVAEEKAAVLKNLFYDIMQSEDIDDYDKRVIQQNFCSIFEYYSLLSYANICSSQVGVIRENYKKKSSR